MLKTIQINKKSKYLLCFLLISIPFSGMGQNTHIQPGEVWNDTEGKPINAHGRGLLYHQGKYYWYGEIKTGKTTRVEYVTSWECYRTKAGGVSCYSSENLLDWKYEGVALTPNTDNPNHDLHTSKVVERPKVIYNEKTNKFVMWLYVDSENYSFASTGVAISDTPEGPFTYLYSMHPNGQMSRDMTLFKDDDGKAYHIFSSDANATTYINLLSDDYTRPSGKGIKIFEGKFREAPAMFKYKDKYYLISSGCTGWSPNVAMIGSATNVLGEWKEGGNPFVGNDGDKTFFSQSTYVLPVQGKENAFIYLGDRWNKTDLQDSRYVWLPIKIDQDEKMSIFWVDKWSMNTFR